MRPKTWALQLTALLPLVACGPQVTEAQLGDAAGATGSLDAGQQATLEASAGCDAEAGVVLPTSSLFLTIDNMEERNDVPGLPPGSGGFWWPLGRGLGNWFFGSAGNDLAITPHDALPENILPPRGDSKRARHVQGSGYVDGADLSAQLQHPTNGPVDLSPYLGISFWAKLTGPSSQLTVALGESIGGSFLRAHHAQRVAVSDQWQRVVLLFDDFRQGASSGSSGGPFTADSVSTIDFVVGLNGESFDLWIDDLALLCRGVCQVHSP